MTVEKFSLFFRHLRHKSADCLALYEYLELIFSDETRIIIIFICHVMQQCLSDLVVLVHALAICAFFLLYIRTSLFELAY